MSLNRRNPRGILEICIRELSSSSSDILMLRWESSDLDYFPRNELFVASIITNKQKIPGKYMAHVGSGLDKWNNTKVYWLDKQYQKHYVSATKKMHRMMIVSKK